MFLVYLQKTEKHCKRTDPLNNSINEKCARIREAFLLKFHEGLAENYFVTGKRGEPKMIKLSRDLIKWEE